MVYSVNTRTIRDAFKKKKLQIQWHCPNCFLPIHTLGQKWRLSTVTRWFSWDPYTHSRNSDIFSSIGGIWIHFLSRTPFSLQWHCLEIVHIEQFKSPNTGYIFSSACWLSKYQCWLFRIYSLGKVSKKKNEHFMSLKSCHIPQHKNHILKPQ